MSRTPSRTGQLPISAPPTRSRIPCGRFCQRSTTSEIPTAGWTTTAAAHASRSGDDVSSAYNNSIAPLLWPHQMNRSPGSIVLTSSAAKRAAWSRIPYLLLARVRMTRKPTASRARDAGAKQPGRNSEKSPADNTIVLTRSGLHGSSDIQRAINASVKSRSTGTGRHSVFG
jgi:hypothetical protein